MSSQRLPPSSGLALTSPVPSPALRLLREAADESWVHVAPRFPGLDHRLQCTATIRQADGEPLAFWLVIDEDGSDASPGLRVRELAPGLGLPAACPSRHIESSCKFCLGWGRSAPAYPRDLASARAWWQALGGFLELQIVARHARRWPPANEWPHGEAARHQEQIERLEAVLPRPIVEFARANYSGQLLARRRPCPCGAGVAIRRCHLRALDALWQLMRAREHAEEEFVAAWNGKVCCGTMDGCPLSRATPLIKGGVAFGSVPGC